jgi:hypothetical protein
MRARPAPDLDGRDAVALAAAVLARRPGYFALADGWSHPRELSGARGTDVAYVQILARLLETVLRRLNQAADRNRLAFFDMAGVELVTAQAARAPVVVRLGEGAADAALPAGSRLAAPPPPGESGPIVFETERAVGLAAARLRKVVSLWPGRDQFIDHSTPHEAGRPFQPFRLADLENSEHAIYISHPTLLALAGPSRLDVEVELNPPGSTDLDVRWDYWDGEVWRPFRAMHPSCLEVDEARLDGTRGLTRSGSYRLEADCAETAVTRVAQDFFFALTQESLDALAAAGVPAALVATLDERVKDRLEASEERFLGTVEGAIGSDALARIRPLLLEHAQRGLEGFWIRGRLDETLPPNPAQVLPEVDSVRLSAIVSRPLRTTEKEDQAAALEKGLALASLPHSDPVIAAPGPLPYESRYLGLLPDKAYAGSEKLDVSKPFYPFGHQPLPGAAFYFALAEAFSKPGARVRLGIVVAQTPQDKLVTELMPYDGRQGDEKLSPTVVWEFWNGREWLRLTIDATGPGSSESPSIEAAEPPPLGPGELAASGTVDFVVPGNMTPVSVNDDEDVWIRVRLVSGGYGFVRHLLVEKRPVSFVVHQPPALEEFRIGYTWQNGPYPAERIVTLNDWQYEDRTEDARWPGRTFAPFRPVGDPTPALYLGFDGPPPVDRLGILFDVREEAGETEGPALVWEYWGASWRRLATEDETRNLRVPGILSFIGAADSEDLSRFGRPFHWVRGRLKEDGPPGAPTLEGVFPNAVWVSQRQTVVDDPLGASTGQPGLVLSFRQVPVLLGEQIEVRELIGARADVEWRILATELGADARRLREIEERLAGEGTGADVQEGDLRLKRDRLKHVTEAWVRWHGQRHLAFSGPRDRHYVLERARGRVHFGDGNHGKVPPPGAAVLARRYLTGGGTAGNVAKRAISQLQAAVGGVEAAFNVRPAEGGAHGEGLAAYAARAGRTLGHRGRSLAAVDYETMAREASSAVAFARAVPLRDAAGRTRPGWVTLLILPESEERRPWPSFGLREHVRASIEERAPASLRAARRLVVSGPEYRPVDVEATLVPRVPAEAGLVEGRARSGLERFLHPLRGGPEQSGWSLGRDVYLSDVAAVLEAVEGVDYVVELSLLLDGVPQGERVPVADDRLVVAGDVRLKLVGA